MVNINEQQQYLTQNCQNLVHTFLSVTLRNFTQGIFAKVKSIFQSSHIAFWWIFAQTRKFGRQSGKIIEHLPKPRVVYLVKYLCCNIEHKSLHDFWV